MERQEESVEDDDGGKEYYTAEDVWGPARPWDILQGFPYREGLSQKQLADALAIKQSHVSEMERGKRTIKLQCQNAWLITLKHHQIFFWVLFKAKDLFKTGKTIISELENFWEIPKVIS